MSESWSWDETLYAGSAAHYVAGRLPYPLELGERIAAEVWLSGRGRAVDVGCGPGSLTLVLAPDVDEVVGIDADGAMIEEATAAACRAGLRNVSWRQIIIRSATAEL